MIKFSPRASQRPWLLSSRKATTGSGMVVYVHANSRTGLVELELRIAALSASASVAPEDCAALAAELQAAAAALLDARALPGPALPEVSDSNFGEFERVRRSRL